MRGLIRRFPSIKSIKNPKEKDAALLQKEAEEALLETLRSRGIGLSHIEARLLLEQESAKKR